MKTIEHAMVSTTFEIPGHTVVKNLGVAKGIIVRSRSLIGSIGAALQSIVGGNITLWTTLSEQSRAHAFDLLCEHAAEMGANAIVGMRYDATELGAGVTEVLAYGSAVIVEKKS